MAGHNDGRGAPRSVILSLRVTEEEAEVLNVEATRTGLSVSDVLRQHVFTKIVVGVRPLEAVGAE